MNDLSTNISNLKIKDEFISALKLNGYPDTNPFIIDKEKYLSLAVMFSLISTIPAYTINQSSSIDITIDPESFKNSEMILDAKNYYNIDNGFDFLNIHSEARYTIEEISYLQKGWDGYNANPIPHKICNIANHLIMYIKDEPEIYPTCRETIQLEFDKAEKSLEMEVFEDRFEFLISHENGNDEFLIKTNIIEAVEEINSFNAT